MIQQIVAANSSQFQPMQFPALRYVYWAALAFAAFLAVPGSELAQNEVIVVNGEPITSYDVAQRTLWQNRTTNFGERMKALLTGDEVKAKFRQMMLAAQPSSQAEAKQAAERIKKELIEDAKRQVLSEGGATRKAITEALIDDKLKLQAARRLGIEITEEEVEGNLAERAARANASPDGSKPDLNAFYEQFEADGIGRKTIQEIIRAQLAWRAVIRRTYGPAKGPETEGGYEGYARSELEKLRQDGIINYPEQ
jgi:peptidyl-prolyl cis-trans isomerase SurA